MLEGKSEKFEFQEMSSSPHQKIKNEQEQTKNAEKGTKRKIENQRRMNEKE